jgi:hypothetical protein
MSRSHREERLDDGLQEVADELRDRRPTLDPLALDAIKLRAMSRARRSTSSPAKGFFMRSRLTTVLTVAFLSLGTGGALAVAGGEDFGLGSNDGSSASCTQYRPGHGYGDKNHCHTGPPGQEGKGGSGGPGNSDFGHSHGH